MGRQVGEQEVPEEPRQERRGPRHRRHCETQTRGHGLRPHVGAVLHTRLNAAPRRKGCRFRNREATAEKAQNRRVQRQVVR